MSITTEKGTKRPVLTPLRLFKTAQVWTLAILSLLRKQRNGSSKTVGGSASGGGSGVTTRSASKQKSS